MQPSSSSKRAHDDADAVHGPPPRKRARSHIPSSSSASARASSSSGSSYYPRSTSFAPSSERTTRVPPRQDRARYPPFEPSGDGQSGRALIYRLGEIEPFQPFEDAVEMVAGDWITHGRNDSPHADAAFYFARHSRAFRVTIRYNELRYRFSIPFLSLCQIFIAIDTSTHSVVLSLQRDITKSTVSFETSEPGTFVWTRSLFDWSEHHCISRATSLTVRIDCGSRQAVGSLLTTLARIVNHDVDIGLATFASDSLMHPQPVDQVVDALAHDEPFLNRGSSSVFEVAKTALAFMPASSLLPSVPAPTSRPSCPFLASPFQQMTTKRSVQSRDIWDDILDAAASDDEQFDRDFDKLARSSLTSMSFSSPLARY